MSSSLSATLSVYVEPLLAAAAEQGGARVVVLGDAELDLGARLLDLGARAVHVYDPDAARASRAAAPEGVTVRPLAAATPAGDLDVRPGAFDLAVIPDTGALPDLASTIASLRRAVAATGAVVAMGRARMEGEGGEEPEGLPPLARPVLGYAELYDAFAVQFDSVTMTGVLPFSGVVFAALGSDDDVAVSVDTRLGEPVAPRVFVVVAADEPVALEPYAIVQTPGEPPSDEAAPRAEHAVEAEAALVEWQLKAELLAAQLDEQRARASEVQGALATAQAGLSALEERLVRTEHALRERDERIEALLAERPDPALLDELALRAQRAEAAVALHASDLAFVAEAHATETAALEAQLRERARLLSAMREELVRREHLVRELVAQVEESGDGGPPQRFEAAPADLGASVVFEAEEAPRLRRKLDEMAFEMARREGELVARAWRVSELENELARARAGERAEARGAPNGDLARDLAGARDELSALRQALTQEHEARVAAESGEELARAREELAQKAALLEQMRARVERAGSDG